MKALRNAKPFRAHGIVYKAQGDEDQESVKVAEGWTEPEGVVFQFTPGVYDLTVENQEDADRPTISFQGISIEADRTVEKVADFSGGTLKVVAKRNGKLFSAYCTIFRGGGRNRKSEGKGPQHLDGRGRRVGENYSPESTTSRWKTRRIPGDPD